MCVVLLCCVRFETGTAAAPDAITVDVMATIPGKKRSKKRLTQHDWVPADAVEIAQFHFENQQGTRSTRSRTHIKHTRTHTHMHSRTTGCL